MKKIIAMLLVLTLVLASAAGCDGGIGQAFRNGCGDDVYGEKPVIYLYPEQETEVAVRLGYRGRLTSTYPEYDDGWHVTAKPEGILVDGQGRSYYCLFWEGKTDVKYDFSKGFVIPGGQTREFLERSLAQLGLTEREAEEFIIYWLPRMEGNRYNLISFQTTAYTETAELDISPAPDTLLRVFMAWKPLTYPVRIPEQTLSAPQRKGFTVVEWGGCECGR